MPCRTWWSPVAGACLIVALAAPVVASGSPAPSPSTSPAPTLVPAQTLVDAGATRLTVRPSADWLVTASGSMWGAVGGAVQQFDGATGAALATIPIPGETCLAMDVGFDSVWVGACHAGSPSLVRIDPATAAVSAMVPLPIHDLQYESSVAAGEGAVWAVSLGPDQVLVKVDPAANTVVATYPIAGELAGVRAGYGGVWIAQPGADAVLRVDPANGTVVSTIAVGSTPRFVAIGEGSVWAMNEADGTVSRIDPATDSVIATILVTPRRVEGGDITVGGGSVWARVSDVLVARIDPSTNQVVARYGPPAGSGSVAADDSAAWVSAHDVNAVWRLPLQ
jgi:virginiamycin B lyase